MSTKSTLWFLFKVLLALFLFVLVMQGKPGLICPLPYRSLAPFTGKVVDAETKEPISGAVVLAVYYMNAYTLVAGSNSYEVDAQESLTDENGEFNLPRRRRWFVLHRGYPEGQLFIFKPGYGFFPRHTRSEALGVNKSWPPSDKYIVFELPKLKTKNERKKNISFSRPDIPNLKMEKYMRLLNEERIFLGFEPF